MSSQWGATQVRTFSVAELCGGGSSDGWRRIYEVGDGMSMPNSIFVPILEPLRVSCVDESTSDYCVAPSIKTAEYRMGNEVSFYTLSRLNFALAYQEMLDTMYQERTQTTKYHLITTNKGNNNE